VTNRWFPWRFTRFGLAGGAALIDIVVASALCVVMVAIAVPVVGGTLERERTIVGAQYLAGQVLRARLDSLKRARSVAVRLEVIGERTQLQLFADGNGNGVLQRDIDRGIDPALAPLEWLDDQARDISLRVNQTIKDVAGTATIAAGDDPLRIGNTALLAFSPLGSATNGTLYVAAHRGPQMAVRVFGATGRVRVLMFDTQTRLWHP
jgi:Tfp pilus assembly protein FimT